uniref:Uncharacterized protein n=1 Tax=Siphoviridae sp. cttuu15 TaxID=2825709 RepID=A0A8S5U1A8_9CAUD|nr:MAG TPA: hypothetical protein [Siphoviridae sp. cttuu15]
MICFCLNTRIISYILQIYKLIRVYFLYPFLGKE